LPPLDLEHEKMNKIITAESGKVLSVVRMAGIFSFQQAPSKQSPEKY